MSQVTLNKYVPNIYLYKKQTSGIKQQILHKVVRSRVSLIYNAVPILKLTELPHFRTVELDTEDRLSKLGTRPSTVRL